MAQRVIGSFMKYKAKGRAERGGVIRLGTIGGHLFPLSQNRVLLESDGPKWILDQWHQGQCQDGGAICELRGAEARTVVASSCSAFWIAPSSFRNMPRALEEFQVQNCAGSSSNYLPVFEFDRK